MKILIHLRCYELLVPNTKVLTSLMNALAACKSVGFGERDKDGAHYIIEDEPDFRIDTLDDKDLVTKAQAAANRRKFERAIPERAIPERAIPERAIPERAIPERAIPERAESLKTNTEHVDSRR